MGLSPVYGDLTDTARQVSLADLALCCVPRGEAGVVLFDEQPVGALIARSPELSERIATPVLALARDERDVLLGSLMAWIDEGGSAAKASDRLFCHRNTVCNRLQRIEALTGRSLTDPVGLGEVYVAVTAARLTPALGT